MNEKMSSSSLKRTKKEKEPVRNTAKETQKVSNSTNTERNESYYGKNSEEKTFIFIDMHKTVLVLDLSN